MKIEYYYHGWRVLEERDGSGNLQRQYTYGNYLDEVWTIDDRAGTITVGDLNDETGGHRHFAHNNTIYHVYGLTDEEGNLVEGYQYDAYGKATVITDGDDGDSIVNFNSNDVRTSGGWSIVNNPYQYTGQRYDPETSLVYYKNRYYDTALGRFISRDPIGYAGGMNLYEYVQSDPIINFDPTGRLFLTKLYHCIKCWSGVGKIMKECNKTKPKEPPEYDEDGCGDNLEAYIEYLVEYGEWQKGCLKKIKKALPSCVKCAYAIPATVTTPLK